MRLIPVCSQPRGDRSMLTHNFENVVLTILYCGVNYILETGGSIRFEQLLFVHRLPCITRSSLIGIIEIRFSSNAHKENKFDNNHAGKCHLIIIPMLLHPK